MKHLSSRKNQEVKYWKKLHTSKGRRLNQQYLIEGWHLIEEAIKSNLDISGILVEERNFEEVEQRLPHLVSFDLISISEEVTRELTQTTTPQGIFAVINNRNVDESYQTFFQGDRWILLDRIQDPGNLGTIIRTADAAGFDGIILGHGCVDVFNEKVIRSTQGSLWNIPIIHMPLEEAIYRLKEQQVKVYAAALDNQALSYRCIDREHRQAYIIGNEGHGIHEDIQKMADQTVYIPIRGKAESLNAGIAASILMFNSINEKFT